MDDLQNLSFSHKTVIRKSLNGNVLSAKSAKEKGCFVQIKINDTAILLLQEVQNRSLAEITSAFCLKYRQDIKLAKDWIADFIQEMIGYEVLTRSSSISPELIVVDAQEMLSPGSADIEVTSSCNLSCQFCYAHGGEENYVFPFNSMPQVLDELVDAGVISLGLTGGEFFAHPQALGILELAVDRFPQIGLLTNGTLITEETVEFISRHRDQILVSISVDSVKPTFHDAIRGLKGAHELAADSIRRLSRQGVKVRLSSVICDENKWEIADLAELALSLGAATFCFSFVENVGRGVLFNASHRLIPSDEYADFLFNTIKKYRSYMPQIHERDIGERRMNCGAGTGRVIIDAQGYVRPCLLSGKTSWFGNVLQRPLQEILSSPHILGLMDVPEPSEESGCPHSCEHLAECGRCLVRGFSRGVAIQNEESAYCDWITKNGLQRYAQEFTRTGTTPVCGTDCDVQRTAR